MTDTLLEAKNVTIRFGGLTAVSEFNIAIRPGELRQPLFHLLPLCDVADYEDGPALPTVVEFRLGGRLRPFQCPIAAMDPNLMANRPHLPRGGAG